MNPVWIILWLSSEAVVVNDVQIGTELIDHSSVRPTIEAARAWQRDLRRHGVGMNFHIYKAKEEEQDVY